MAPTKPCAAARSVVDDDARNIFALASLLESQNVEVITATSGARQLGGTFEVTTTPPHAALCGFNNAGLLSKAEMSRD
jgi:response regulator RpfG family c-di-GMP phosphodiesterase